MGNSANTRGLCVSVKNELWAKAQAKGLSWAKCLEYGINHYLGTDAEREQIQNERLGHLNAIALLDVQLGEFAAKDAERAAAKLTIDVIALGSHTERDGSILHTVPNLKTIAESERLVRANPERLEPQLRRFNNIVGSSLTKEEFIDMVGKYSRGEYPPIQNPTQPEPEPEAVA